MAAQQFFIIKLLVLQLEKTRTKKDITYLHTSHWWCSIHTIHFIFYGRIFTAFIAG